MYRINLALTMAYSVTGINMYIVELVLNDLFALCCSVPFKRQIFR